MSGVFVAQTFLTPNLDTLEVKWGQTTFLETDKDLQLVTSSSSVRAKISSCHGNNERNEAHISAAVEIDSSQQCSESLLSLLHLDTEPEVVLWLSPLATR